MTKAVATRPETRVFSGSLSQVRQVRDFVGHLVAEYPAADDIVLLASELATNAIVHTASGNGGTFTVAVQQTDARVRVEVGDAGSAKIPVAQPCESLRESGCGLALVNKMAASWGHFGGPRGRVVWYEMGWK